MPMQPAQAPMKCPVCSAGFRGSTTCQRCGSDLTPLMRIAARSWALRQCAREKLLEGKLDEAVELTIAATKLQRQRHVPLELLEAAIGTSKS